MNIDKTTKKHLLQILAFGILLYCGIEHFDVVLSVFQYIFRLLLPFLLGCTIAFILNVPMAKIEGHLFKGKEKCRKWRRPCAFLITLLCLIGILVICFFVIVPELANTVSNLTSQIPAAFDKTQKWIVQTAQSVPFLEGYINTMNLDWTSISSSIVGIIQAAGSGLLSSGFGFITSIVSGVTTFIIGFTFSIYILFQKEKLGGQVKQVAYALLPGKTADKFFYVTDLSHRIFASFLSGQCLEAIILGTMFVITMTLFRLPYAMLIGVLIALTALIPIFGAFIGCALGIFLIVMVNPMQALWFLILFLVLQQLEGNLIYPHVVGGSVGLPSIWVLVAVTLGGSLFGILGILFFIPLCSVCYALFREYIKKRLAERKE